MLKPRFVILPALVAGSVFLGVVGFGQPSRNEGAAAATLGSPSIGKPGISQSTADIMAAQAAQGPRKNVFTKREFEIPGREHRPQNPAARFDPQTAPGQARNLSTAASAATGAPIAPKFSQTIGLQFDGVTGPTETGSFPPDSMGAIGPSQFIIFVNGRIRSFNTTTGSTDGVMNVDPDVFFKSVMTPLGGGITVNFTSDPQIRYDRLSKRWFLTIIDIPSSDSTHIDDHPNRVLIAVSDAASNGVISGSTVWTFFFIQQDRVGQSTSTNEVLDYDSLGVDANALYIGGNMFDAPTGNFTSTNAYVVRKSSVLSGGPIVVTAFRGLIIPSGDGPDSPRGVDNYDPNATEGYIIGSGDAAFGELVMRRISNPGGTPSISSNIIITVNATAFPLNVPTLASNLTLDALDDRLFAAHIRNGRLWTAHNIAVNSSGVASAGDRDAVRWYELSVPVGSGTPTVVQSGTIFDPSGSSSTARWYWIPSVVVSGQGHAALGFSTAGPSVRIDAATTGRVVNDSLGVVDAPTIFTSSAFNYNPNDQDDPHRWGDYSFTSVDPNDDMTMWTVQEFCDGSDTYGIEVVKLLAPPPAQPTSASSSVPLGSSSANVTITGTSSAGSGFFDPGSGFANRIRASVTGGVTVNSATYTDPTHVTLNLNTTAASNSQANVTITNPDGQSRTGNGILTVGAGGPTPTPT
ncbi:MAG: hypothetical protein JO201_03085, partial [Verrucomicrobia bacterium]|nr:hypothetical protein [Verrucomicrobiota bacterium]